MLPEALSGGHSSLRRLDPRVRLAAAAILSVAFALLTRLDAALAALALGSGLLCLSRPAPGPLARRLCAVNLFVLFLWLTLPWSVPGGPVLGIGPLALTKEGLSLSLLITLKANAIVFVFLALAASMPLPLLAAALEGLRCPSRLTLLLIFTYRYIAVLAEEWQRLMTAASLRGFAPRTDLHTYRTYANLIGMLFVRALDRSRRVWEAMQLRGFAGRFPSLALLRCRAADGVFLAGLVLAAMILLVHDARPAFFPEALARIGLLP